MLTRIQRFPKMSDLHFYTLGYMEEQSVASVMLVDIWTLIGSPTWSRSLNIKRI